MTPDPSDGNPLFPNLIVSKLIRDLTAIDQEHGSDHLGDLYRALRNYYGD